MHYEGFTNAKIAELECLEEHAVGKYIKSYKVTGLSGLEMAHNTEAKPKLIQPFLDENKARLELMFLPPYSPELNLIEGLWGG